MVDAFATVEDFGTRLHRVFTSDEQAWILSLLEDASTYLREDVIGAQVWPAQSSTFTAWPDGDGNVPIPQFPVVSVDAVTRDGEPAWFCWVEDHVHVGCGEQVQVTFTYGYTEPPASLARWTMVLASQALLPLEQQLGLTVGGLSSIAIDDFKAAFADAGEGTGITLSDRNIALIRNRFSVSSSFVVGTR